jgi:hypothetical protein
MCQSATILTTRTFICIITYTIKRDQMDFLINDLSSVAFCSEQE